MAPGAVTRYAFAKAAASAPSTACSSAGVQV